MTLSVLHKFRVAFAAAIGSAIALASAAGIFLHLNEGQKTVRLSDRIDPARAVVYVSTSDRQILFAAIERYRSMISNAPSESDIAPGDYYEFALLRTGSGKTAWMSNQKDIDAALLLPENSSRASLTRTPLFVSLPESARSFVWFDLDSFPLPESAGADIVRAGFSAYTEGMLLLSGTEHGTLMLGRASLSSRTQTDDNLFGDETLLGISLGNPKTALSSFTAGLTTKNPPLLEGLTGILAAQLEKNTGSSDLSAITSDLLSGPLELLIERGEKSKVAMTVSGTAKNASVFSAWLQAAASRMMEGRVRRREFLNEYTRTDVATDDAGALTDIGHEYGWLLQHIGGSGSDLSLTVATLGPRYVIGSDRSLVQKKVQENMPMRTGKLGSGRADIAWASTQAESLLPFLTPLRPVTEAILGPSPATLTWSIAPISGGISIDWRISRLASAAPQSR